MFVCCVVYVGDGRVESAARIGMFDVLLCDCSFWRRRQLFDDCNEATAVCCFIILSKTRFIYDLCMRDDRDESAAA